MTKARCTCAGAATTPFLVALTGGPCAGKTTLMRLVESEFCQHVVHVPEIATLLFANGFPYRTSTADRRSAQRAIYQVQLQFESIAARTPGARAVLCDRGTVDGLVYWPGAEEEYWDAVGSTAEREFARYWTVIHLRSYSSARLPDDPGRREPPEHAPQLEERTLAAWAKHPRLTVVAATPDFEDKARSVFTQLHKLLPSCRIRRDDAP